MSAAKMTPGRLHMSLAWLPDEPDPDPFGIRFAARLLAWAAIVGGFVLAWSLIAC